MKKQTKKTTKKKTEAKPPSGAGGKKTTKKENGRGRLAARALALPTLPAADAPKATAKGRRRSRGKAAGAASPRLRRGAPATIPAALAGLAVPIGQLHADPENVRQHPERNIEAIAKSLKRFGQQAPAVYVIRRRQKVVIKGNGMLAAARGLGWKALAAVKSGLAEREAMAYAIADNRTSDLSEFDEKLLAAQLAELGQAGEDLADLGFTDAEIAELAAPAEEADSPGGSHHADLDELKEKYLAHPPAFTWTLIGIATVRYHEINDAIERIHAVAGVVIKTGVTDAHEEDR